MAVVRIPGSKAPTLSKKHLDEQTLMFQAELEPKLKKGPSGLSVIMI